MNAGTLTVLITLVAIVVLVIMYMVRTNRRGGHASCPGCTDSHCNACLDKTVKAIERADRQCAACGHVDADARTRHR